MDQGQPVPNVDFVGAKDDGGGVDNHRAIRRAKLGPLLCVIHLHWYVFCRLVLVKLSVLGHDWLERLL